MLQISKENSSFIKVIGDFEDKKVLSNEFSVFAPNFMFNPKYKAGIWDGKIRFFNLSSGLLPIGLLDQALAILDNHHIEVEWVDSETANKVDLRKTKLKQLVDLKFDDFIKSLNLPYEAREYQLDGVKAAIINETGILEHATSSGKTYTSYILINWILEHESLYTNSKIMFVVPNIGLLYQFISDFKEYGMTDVDSLVGLFYGDAKDLSKKITVGTWQSLSKQKNFLESVTHVICDEVHKAKAVEIKALLENCVNTTMRIGCTGSLPDEKCDLTTVIGNFGPVIGKVTARDLIDNGWAPEVKILQISLYYPASVTKMLRGREYRDEKIAIKMYPKRFQLVKGLVDREIREDHNVLLLFDEIEFGKEYRDYLKEAFPNNIHLYIDGSISGEEREKIRKITDENKGVILLASLGTTSTGISIKRLHALIGLWLGNSSIRLKQVIGRGLRLHEDKNELTFIDISDQLKYSRRHSADRLKVYMKEGHDVQALEFGLDV